jgi:hypothetical protein
MRSSNAMQLGEIHLSTVIQLIAFQVMPSQQAQDLSTKMSNRVIPQHLR